ncbi:ATP-binding protein (plasmid) [Rhizobium sp. RCAM05350]|nr:ATP-binding protein [Rhizobium sp. RCAM05350]
MLDPKERALADFLQGMQDRYFGLPHDELLHLTARSLLTSVAAHRIGDKVHIPGKRRIITIVGQSNAGKTRALIEHFVNAKELQPYIDENGIEINPVLIFDAPSPCTPKLLAIAGLQALGLNVSPGIAEGEAWEAFRTALKAHKIMLVCIDEAQHAINNANVLERSKIADALKLSVQMPDWPLRLVLAGVPPLDSFVAGHRQLKERNYPIRFDPLGMAEGIVIIADKLSKIIRDQGGLELSPELLADDFTPRLNHAASGEFGGVVQLIRDATEISLREGKDIVTTADFAVAYEVTSGCRSHENVFTASNWSEIDVATASLRELPFLPNAMKKAGRGKELTYGERP